MDTGKVKAGGAYVELGLKDKLKAGLDKAAQKLRSFSAGVAQAGAATAGLGTAILTPLLASSAGFASTADGYATTAGRAQMAASAVSELQHAAKMTDVSAGGLEKGLQNLRKTTQDAADGGKSAQKTFSDLGVSWEKLADLPLNAQLEIVADAIAQMDDPNKQAAAAFEMFGKAGKEMLPLLLSGSAGIRKWREEAKSLGIAMSDAEIASGGELSDNLDRLKDSSRGLSDRIGAALAPALNELLPRMVGVVAMVSNWIRENPGLVQGIAAGAVGLVVLGSALGAAGTAGLVFAGILSGLSAALPMIGAVLGAVVSPAGLGVAALTAGAVAWVKYTDSGQAAAAAIGSDLDTLKTTVSDTFQGIKAAISSGDWEAASDIMWAGLEAAWLTGKSRLVQVWEDIKAAMVEAFAGAAIAVSNLWNSTIEGIANKILELASQKGVVGDLLSKVLGVDLRSEESRSQMLDFKQKEVQKRIWNEAIAGKEAESLTAVNDPAKLAQINADLKRYRAELAKIEGREAPQSVLSTAQEAVAQATEQAREATAGYWLDIARQQRESSDAAIAEARRRETEARSGLAERSANAQLQAQTDGYASDFDAAMEGEPAVDAAAAAAAAAAAEALESVASETASLTGKKDRASGPEGTFSSYALGQMFAGADVDQLQLSEQKEMVKILRAIHAAGRKGVVWGAA
ncbi:MAG: hypothetical protein MUE50_00120 [Pirellulaceae bacterium]|jgi:hypothetical protein|nr:hypothetical protein [Pirellulaceae bacterium]